MTALSASSQRIRRAVLFHCCRALFFSRGKSTFIATQPVLNKLWETGHKRRMLPIVQEFQYRRRERGL
jgi:hypothetical protein